jgi:hypothetical protein
VFWGLDDEPGFIVELPSYAPGLALELHAYLRREGTLAVWLLKDGTELGEVFVGRAGKPGA